MNNKLKEYVSGELHLTPIMNLLMNERSKNWYDELGKYIVKTLDIQSIPELKFLSDRLKEKSLIKKLKDFNNDNYFLVSSFFLTSALNEETLKKMFGNPIYHSEFGEGFDKKKKYSYASYFVEIDGVWLHIGYDHRGTMIEIEYTSDVYKEIFKEDAEKCFNVLKKLVDIYKEKV